MTDKDNMKSGRGYCVDLVICLDATGSMRTSIGRAKQIAKKYCDMLMSINADEDYDIALAGLRARLVVYRGCDSSVEQTRFLTLPDEAEKLWGLLDAVEPDGDDIPDRVLEALALAIRSDFDTAAAKRRQIIFLATDMDIEHIARTQGGDGSAVELGDLTEIWNEGERGRAYSPNIATMIALAAGDCELHQLFGNWDRTMCGSFSSEREPSRFELQEMLDTVFSS